jgi:hypothetical protein
MEEEGERALEASRVQQYGKETRLKELGDEGATVDHKCQKRQ